jgi:hypothetical protein
MTPNFAHLQPQQPPAGAVSLWSGVGPAQFILVSCPIPRCVNCSARPVTAPGMATSDVAVMLSAVVWACSVAILCAGD